MMERGGSPVDHRKRTLLLQLASLALVPSAIAKQRSEKVVPPSSKLPPKPAEEQYPELNQVRKYMGALHDGVVLKGGSPAELARLFRGQRLGGFRPVIPVISEKSGRIWYPDFSPEYKGPHDKTGWPALRVGLRGQKKGEEGRTVLSNAVRVVDDRICVPAGLLTSTFGSENIALPALRDKGNNLAFLHLQLNHEHSQAPVLSRIPEVPESNIVDGTYAVGLGRSDPQIPSANGLENGSYALTGFLVSIRSNPALKEMFVHTLQNAQPPVSEENIASIVKLVENSFFMIPDPDEYADLMERVEHGEDGFGQPVYVRLSAKAGFERMGMLHGAGRLIVSELSDDGMKVPDVPFYLVHGSRAFAME